MYSIKDFETERLKRLEKQDKASLKYQITQLSKDLKNFSRLDQKSIKDFFDQVYNLEYSHPGLDKFGYIIHPIRVARILLSKEKTISSHTIKLALGHNIKELVKNYSLQKLKFLDDDLINDIDLLTVDRDKQWNLNYKKKYYHYIENNKNAALVKIVDKFDNLYLLNNNPSMRIKKLYLKEISDFVIPLASKFSPSLVNNFIFNYNHVNRLFIKDTKKSNV